MIRAADELSNAVAELKQYPTGNIVDAMQRLGLRHGWLEGLTSRGAAPGAGCFAGQVMTAQWAPPQSADPKRLTLYEIVRERAAETILLVAGGRPDCFLVGDNTVTAAKVAGFEAVLVDGATRDVAGLRRVGIGMFTVAVSGAHPPTLGMVTYNQPVLFRGTLINPGDVVAADEDGAVVIPGSHVTEVARHAAIIAALEREQRAVIDQNGSLDELFAVLRKKKG